MNSFRRIFLGSCAFAISFIGVGIGARADTPKLMPRIETGIKLGTERHIGLTEAWIPLSQNENSVIYGDMRFMGDNASNREGNFGVGYRTYNPRRKHIIGAHAWFDQRSTKRGSTFHQITVGGEYIRDAWEFRLNGYIPLSSEETHATPNAGSSTAYLAGTGIFFDTNGRVVEEPQGGFDAEVGAKIPTPFDRATDSTRLYMAGYHFNGDLSKATTGWRTRFTTDVNNLISVGGRVQRDKPRGSQGFLEITFKFGGKQSYKTNGLRSHG